MRDDLEKWLIEKYPRLYRYANQPNGAPFSAHGFECGDGWFRIIREFSDKAEKEIVERNLDIAVAQIKVKFSEMRLYLDGGYDKEVQKLACETEYLAARTCEQCGDPREPVHGITICEECLFSNKCNKAEKIPCRFEDELIPIEYLAPIEHT